jgi:exonuclease SbcC
VEDPDQAKEMKIKRLKIKNFQSHRDTTLDFDGGINVIVGDTDVGKSAIIRAIRWVMRNKPLGQAFWNRTALEAGEDCFVGLAVDIDGKEIKILRRRDPSANFYKLITDETYEFTAFGSEVPDEVQKIVGSPVAFSHDLLYDFNISPQIESPFLVAENPRAFALVIGKLTGIDVLDVADNLIRTATRETANRVKAIQNEQAIIQHELDATCDPSQAILLLAKVQDHQSSLAYGQQLLENLTAFVATIDKLSALKESTEAQLRKLTPLLDETVRLVGMLEKTTISLSDFVKRVDELTELEIRVTSKKHILSQFPTIDEQQLKKREEAIEQLSRLKDISEKIDRHEYLCTSKRDELLMLEQEIGTEDQKLFTMVQQIETCPLSEGEFFQSCKTLIHGKS